MRRGIILARPWQLEAMGKRKNTVIHRTTGIASLDTSLQDIIDGVDDDLLVINSEYRVKLANSTICHRLPHGIESAIGKHCYEVFQGRDKPCHAPLWECPLVKVLQSGNSVTLIHPYRTLGADSVSDKYVKITMWPLKDNYGNINAVVELRRDVTAERKLERDILRWHHHLDALSYISSAVSGLWNLNAILNAVLDSVLRIFGGSVGGILLFDEQIQQLRYKAHRGLSAKYIREMCLAMGEGIAGKVAQTGEPILLEDVSKDPSAAHPDLISTEGLKGFISVPLKAKEKVVGVMNIASTLPGKFAIDDMYLLNSIGCQLGTAIEQAKLYQRLNEAKERYQILLRQALIIQEEERKRIARELHDETGQELTALALNLQAISEMMEMSGVEDAEIKAILMKTHSIAVHASAELTRLIRELRPTLLDTLGLPAAVRHLAETNLTCQGISVSTEFKGLEQRLPSEIELALFRITQEAISNIVRHSEAKKATISLECNANECVLRVEDDGEGFDVSQIRSIDATGRGAGLFGMKERVTLVDGKCAIESQPGRGTKVVAKVPIIRSTANAEDKSAGGR